MNCTGFFRNHFGKIYNNSIFQDYWRNMVEKYVPIKKQIILEAERIKLKLFGNSNNILGILIRGTDFISVMPKGHHIPPTCEMVFEDIKIMDKKYNYDYFFITTEDKILRKKFIIEFKEKIKYYVKRKYEIKYDYSNPKLLAKKNRIIGNFIFMKIYLINIIILSKCLDIISSKTNGAIGAFILTKGFRFSKIYDLGTYH